MMDIQLPRLGEGADSGTVVNVLVKPGQKIRKDETLIELENEKAVAPIPSPAAGTVTKVHVKEGDKISVGQTIASLEPSDGASAQAAPKPAEPRREGPKESGSARPAATGSSTPGVENQIFHPRGGTPGIPPPASPAIRKIARDLGIDLSRVRGSERGGRITLEDLRAYIRHLQEGSVRGDTSAAPQAKPQIAPKEQIDFSKWGPIERKPLSSLRQTIGRKMQESWTTVPHVTQFDDADITALWELRKKYAAAYEKKGARLTLTGFAIKVVVGALKKYPNFNASLDEAAGELILKKYFHIGIAVDTEQGLIVPVLRDADKKSILDISIELEKIAEKTRTRKISLDELKGSGFTISNLGSIGGSHFTPIVNAPEVAILGIGRGAGKLPLSLSYDHRAVDGADGARFIRALVEGFENFKEEDVKI